MQGTALKVNNAPISDSDVIVSNGVIHTLDAVLIPNTENILQYIVKHDDMFSDLFAALIVTNLESVLEGKYICRTQIYGGFLQWLVVHDRTVRHDTTYIRNKHVVENTFLLIINCFINRPLCCYRSCLKIDYILTVISLCSPGRR